MNEIVQWGCLEIEEIRRENEALFSFIPLALFERPIHRIYLNTHMPLPHTDFSI